MWRPKNWNNPYIEDLAVTPVVTDIQGTKNLMHNAYEAGATDMLKALEKGADDRTTWFRRADSGDLSIHIAYKGGV